MKKRVADIIMDILTEVMGAWQDGLPMIVLSGWMLEI